MRSISNTSYRLLHASPGLRLTRRPVRNVNAKIITRNFYNDTFREGDILLVRRAKGMHDDQPQLTEPLKLHLTEFEDTRYAFNCRYGIIKHRDLVGKKSRDLFETSKGSKMVVTWPTMEEYVILTKNRTTTPIYPGDAQCIVNMMDLHVTAPPNPALLNSNPEPLASATSDSALNSTSLEPQNTAVAPSRAGMDDDHFPDIELEDLFKESSSSKPTAESKEDSSVNSTTSISTVHPVTTTTTTATTTNTSSFTPNEILEIGTGHGSLTLHLARAIHASSNINVDPTKPGTILHTVDRNIGVSNAARKMVKGFRRGMYYTPHSIKFYSEGCGPWLVRELEQRSGRKLTYLSSNTNDTESSSSVEGAKNEITKYMINHRLHRHPFLHAALIDLPFAEPYLPLLAASLHQGAFCGFFAPSITQLVRLIGYSQANGFPFFFEKTVEFPNTLNELGSNLREWDVRRVRMRRQDRRVVKDLKGATTAAAEVEGDVENGNGGGEGGGDDRKGKKLIMPDTLDMDEEFMTVCRPLVGGKVRGGGFYTVARRKADKEEKEDNLEV